MLNVAFIHDDIDVKVEVQTIIYSNEDNLSEISIRYANKKVLENPSSP